jgi:hypothetical protein
MKGGSRFDWRSAVVFAIGMAAAVVYYYSFERGSVRGVDAYGTSRGLPLLRLAVGVALYLLCWAAAAALGYRGTDWRSQRWGAAIVVAFWFLPTLVAAASPHAYASTFARFPEPGLLEPGLLANPIWPVVGGPFLASLTVCPLWASRLPHVQPS